MRIRILLALCFSVLLPRNAAAEPDPALVDLGKEYRFRLTREEPLQVVRLKAPPGKALHLFAVSDVDVDLFAHHAKLDQDDLGEARYDADSIDSVEYLAVDTPSPTWFVHLLNPDSDDRALEVRFYAWTDPQILPAGRRVRGTLAAGQETAAHKLFVLGELDFAGVRVECDLGEPALTLKRAGVTVPGGGRGGGATAILRSKDRAIAGMWEVEIRRPKGLESKLAMRYAVEGFLAPRLPNPDDERRIDTDPFHLDDLDGERKITVLEDDWQTCVFDVLPGTHGMDLSVSAEKSDIDLYVSRHLPVDMKTPNWSWASWKEGDEDDLHVGGRLELPAGRYWIRVVHHEGEADRCVLKWRRRKGPGPAAIRNIESEVRADAPWKVEFEENQPVCWVRLPRGVFRGAHLQVLGSDKDVDLIVARDDTGETILRQETDRNDEYLEIDRDLVVPPEVGLRVGVFRWTVGGDVSAGSLHLGVGKRPVPPSGYLPPYASWGDTPYGRALASTVEVVTEDGTGSGCVVSPGGLVLTCHHVIEDGGEIIIAFPRSQRGRPRQAFTAEVVFQDEDLDLAILHIRESLFGRSAKDVSNLAFVPLGRPEDMKLGDPIRVLGYGHAGSSRFGSNLLMLAGILSGVETERDADRWFITDARLGDGNSGGGYYNSRYELIAVHDMAVGDDGSSLSYARPISRLPREWRDRIRKDGGRFVEKLGEDSE